MFFNDTVIGLQNYFKTKWAATAYASYPVYYDGQEVPHSIVEGNNPWLVFSIYPEEGGQIEVGKDVNSSTARYFGLVIVQIFVRSGIGTKTLHLMADVVSGIFLVKQIENSNSGLIRTRRPIHRPAGNDERGWLQHNIQVIYFRDVNETQI